MKISNDGLLIIQQSEGLRQKAYLDTGGVPTIGYGHTKGVKLGMTCTYEQAVEWLREDVESAEADVKQYVKVPLAQGAFDALVSFVFNVGGPQFADSTLLHLLNQGDYIGASNQLERWIYDNGQRLKGLITRREAERQEFIFYPGFSHERNF